MTDGHVSTKDHPGDYDALETAKPDEPIFTLQGGDPLGEPTVLYWADQARKLARQSDSPQERHRLLEKAKMAEKVAWAMKDYREGTADLPATEPIGVAEAQTESTVERVRQRQALIAGVSVLHNALATVNDLAETIEKMDVHPEVVQRLRHDVESLRLSADTIEPRRGNERS